ncbi:Eukaryotic translation initiation factor 3 subunit B [Armadillidium vulgare]|nr:Eukaryotic translation initiation factor 3 subunit B [Armadillidium vulgare]
MRLSKASREIIEKRQQQMSSFIEYRKRMTEKFNSEKSDRLRLRNSQDTDTLTSNVNDFEEEIVEFLVKKEVIPIE